MNVLVSDAICSALQTEVAWTNPERRRLHLLRADTEFPISADPRVTVRTDLPEENAWRIVVTAQVDDQDGDAELDFVNVFGCFDGVEAGRLDGLDLLGFDVCDRDLYSAILNCGYVHEADRDDAKKRWRAVLTANHLFGDLADARALRSMADVRVAGHAPFFVFRVYGLRL